MAAVAGAQVQPDDCVRQPVASGALCQAMTSTERHHNRPPEFRTTTKQTKPTMTRRKLVLVPRWRTAQTTPKSSVAAEHAIVVTPPACHRASQISLWNGVK